MVKFSSSSAGVFDLPLTFEAVGTGRRYALHVSGTCAFPSINADPRNVFMRRVKHRAEGAIPPVSKRFVVSRGQYEFGPLLTWKKAENRYTMIKMRYCMYVLRCVRCGARRFCSTFAQTDKSVRCFHYRNLNGLCNAVLSVALTAGTYYLFSIEYTGKRDTTTAGG